MVVMHTPQKNAQPKNAVSQVKRNCTNTCTTGSTRMTMTVLYTVWHVQGLRQQRMSATSETLRISLANYLYRILSKSESASNKFQRQKKFGHSFLPTVPPARGSGAFF